MSETLCFDMDISSAVCKYADKITLGLNEHRKDVYSFKEDIKLSMLVAMEELVANGYTVEAALKSAADKCENDEFTKREILSLKQSTKKLQKIYSIIARISFILSILILITAYTHYLVADSFETYSNACQFIKYTLGQEDNLITEDMKSSLRKFVDSRWYVEAGALYISDADHTEVIPDNFDYSYSPSGRTDKEYFSGQKSNFLFSIHTYHDFVSVPFTGKTVNAVYSYKTFGHGFYVIPFIVFLTYWTTFALWGRINILYAEYNKRWVLLVFLTNILGYFIFEYHLNEQRKNFPLTNL
ncbi:MAG: hypothetical protein Q8930_02320 [Bacillota bacterium]|nr:hypothetical protein [Bacillota bacterium]